MDDTQHHNQPPNDAADAPNAAAEESQHEAASAADVAAPADDAAAKANEYLAGWQRAKADYANLQRESDARLAELRRYAAAGFASELLPVLDTFRKAMEQPPECAADDAAKRWVEGIGHIRDQLDTVLAKAGIALIAETGTPFDPELHEAMLQEPAANGAAPGSVLRILEPGYRMHDRVLRPAKVIVAE